MNIARRKLDREAKRTAKTLRYKTVKKTQVRKPQKALNKSK